MINNLSLSNNDMSNSLQQIKLIIWDWYKTLSNKHMYSGLQSKYPGAFEAVQNYFIAENDKIKQWQKGEISYREMHQVFSKLTGLPVEEFDHCLGILKNDHDIDPDILIYVQKFAQAGKQQVIATDNFDIWDEFFLPQYSEYLNQYFVNVYNTAKYRMLKEDDQAQFMQLILSEQKLTPQQVLLIDDNDSFTKSFAALGGMVVSQHSKADLLAQLAELKF